MNRNEKPLVLTIGKRLEAAVGAIFCGRSGIGRGSRLGSCGVVLMVLAAAAAGFGRLRLGGRSDGFGWSGPAGIGLGRDRAGRGGLGRRSGLRRWRRRTLFFLVRLGGVWLWLARSFAREHRALRERGGDGRTLGAEPDGGERRRLGAGAVGAPIAAVAVD